MQATIRIEKTLLEEAMSLAGLATQKATVEEALRQFIRRSKQKRVKALRGTLHWEGNLSEMRTGRTYDTR